MAIIDAMRKVAPRRADPLMWRGVAETEAVGEGVMVRFRESLEPRLLEVGGAVVRCHLHDPEALGDTSMNGE